MERREKSVERVLMVEKLKGVMVGKRGGDGGPFTPLHAWRLELPSQKNGGNNNAKKVLNFPTTSTISARKLCAIIYESFNRLHFTE
ncbi:hypothetical protein Lalb_Chr17g0338901 [Lupinus albus]|uniref:Uncharacterized protein n=1 Tax=Lupinus albus TaxID=3870 RepID=A0A6A4P7Y8_LUPAL|nr:hypothetical protein Lalb_Chr17g0338901 [Lupinus albus]